MHRYIVQKKRGIVWTYTIPKGVSTKEAIQKKFKREKVKVITAKTHTQAAEIFLNTKVRVKK